MNYETAFTNLLPDDESKSANIGNWKTAHNSALLGSGRVQIGHGTKEQERAIKLLVQGFLAYADAHKEANESGIGEDFVLGVYWKEIGQGIRGLLNGNCGRFDCGTLDKHLHGALEAENLQVD